MHALRLFASGVLSLVLASGCALSHERASLGCDCDASETCVGGACVQDCGLPIDSIAATLDPSLSIVRTFCVELAEGPIGAFARADGELEILHARLSTEGRGSTVVLDQLGASVATGTLSASTSCTTSFTADRDGVSVRLSRDLAISPDGAFAAWGLVARVEEMGVSRLDLTGAWYLARRDGCAVETHAFPRVEGVAFGSDGRGPHVLVSGGLGGPVYMDGVFLGDSRVLASQTPGSIWRVGDAVVVGGVLGHGVMPATLIPLASVRPGDEVRVGEDGVLTGDAQTHRFVSIDGLGIVSEASRSGVDRVGLELRSLEIRTDGLVFGEPTLLAGPEVTAAIPIVGSRRFLLRHARGLLLVE